MECIRTAFGMVIDISEIGWTLKPWQSEVAKFLNRLQDATNKHGESSSPPPDSEWVPVSHANEMLLNINAQGSDNS